MNAGKPIMEGGSSNADLCSWKEGIPFPKHLSNNAEAK